MDWKDYIDDMTGDLRVLNKTIPEAAKGFRTLSKAAEETGVLELKYKECIAVGIAVVTHCEPCIVFHVRALARAGGTREELADVLAMSVQMGGGPGLMYAAKALSAWDQINAEQT